MVQVPNTFTWLYRLSQTASLFQPLDKVSMHKLSMHHTDLPLGYYRHFKGAIYRVAGLARDCDSQQWMVYYQCCYGDWSYWLRPLDNFCATIIKEGTSLPRFTFLGEEAPADLIGVPGGV